LIEKSVNVEVTVVSNSIELYKGSSFSIEFFTSKLLINEKLFTTPAVNWSVGNVLVTLSVT